MLRIVTVLGAAALAAALVVPLGGTATASQPKGSPVAFFPTRLDYPTVDGPPASVAAQSIQLSPIFERERVAATAGGEPSVTIWELRPGATIDVSQDRHELLLPPNMVGHAVAFGHVYGTPRSDLVVAGGGYLAVFKRLSSGAAAFGNPVATVLPHGTDERDVALADFNGDGKLDVVVADGYPPGADPATVSVLFGNGNGTFSNPSVISVGNTYQTAGVVKTALLNGDSLPDIVVGDTGCGYGGSDVLVLLNNGGGTFAPPTPASSSGDGCDQAVEVGDLNRDGLTDIVSANPNGFYNPTDQVAVLLGHGDGTFAAPSFFPAPLPGSAITIDDFNGDMRPDVAIAGTGGMTVLPGDGTGKLLGETPVVPTGGPDYYGGGLSLEDTPTDLDNDGMTDIVFGNAAGITVAYAGLVGPSAGPIAGGTTVTITGRGFSSGTSVTFGGKPAASVNALSPFELQAVTPPVPPTSNLAVDVVAGSLTAHGGFRYYIPQIGRLVSASSTGGDRCTATVVRNPNNDAVATAGHCVGGGGVFFSSFYFAPGYTGLNCQFEAQPADYFGCGDPPPFGIWTAYRVASNDQWLNNTDHDLDYGFLDMNTNSQGQHIAQVAGAFPIEFNADRSQSWTAWGLPAPSTALLSVSGNESDDNVGDPGPPNMTLPGTLLGGASGGPWIGGTTGAVSAVNSTSDSGVVRGTYLGSEARNTFKGM